MPSKTLRVDGAAGVIAIYDYGTSTSAITNPSAYIDNINFHSSLPYTKVLAEYSVSHTFTSYTTSTNQEYRPRIATTTLGNVPGAKDVILDIALTGGTTGVVVGPALFSGISSYRYLFASIQPTYDVVMYFVDYITTPVGTTIPAGTISGTAYVLG